jgi:hypothetical protein
MSGRGRRPAIGALIIAASFLAGGYFLLRYMGSGQKERIVRLEALADRLKSESVPIRFMILSKDAEEIKARIKIYDLDGAEIAVIERSWPGSSLYVDMLLAPIAAADRAGGSEDESWLAFPYRIFTDRVSPAAGTTLFDAYERDGFPRVLDGVEWKPAERAAISSVFKAARESAAAGESATASSKGAFGSAVHEASGVSGLEVGVVYRVVCRVKGGVEIMEE